MRYEQVANLVRLAVRLQGTLSGLTLDDIQAGFSVSRRTAERMRDAVAAAFGPFDKWWQAHVSGDASDGKRPTRNMASSQIACVNFLPSLVDIPGALTDNGWLESERCSLAVHDRLHRLGFHFRTRERVRLVGNPVDWSPFRLLRAEQADRHREGGGTHLETRRGSGARRSL